MYLDRDGVTELAGKWGRAAEGLGKAAEHVRSTEMNAQSFGAEHAEQMASVRQRLDQLADNTSRSLKPLLTDSTPCALAASTSVNASTAARNMRDWGRYVGDYRGKL
ncbi:hypothetical protein [Mycobacteroides abscessus]|uniref:hypothetical protein n=1 Tax=Mycobacteroides abscessus TaxID=36809 RepID=UPI0011B22ED2|nr:hypothetical protein [Mycobacteroides abscessus]